MQPAKPATIIPGMVSANSDRWSIILNGIEQSIRTAHLRALFQVSDNFSQLFAMIFSHSLSTLLFPSIDRTLLSLGAHEFLDRLVKPERATAYCASASTSISSSVRSTCRDWDWAMREYTVASRTRVKSTRVFGKASFYSHFPVEEWTSIYPQ